MKQKLCIALALGAALAFSSCSKKLGQFNADYFRTNPNPLEVVGQNVPATVTGNIPAKFFVKNASVTVTPYLVFGDKEVVSQPYTFQGQNVRGNAPVVSWDNGGTVTIPVNYVYQPEMAQSDLQLAFTVNQGNKEYVLPRVSVAKGVVGTAALADAGSVNPALAPDAFQRIINEKYAADILFLINKANIRADQLKTDAMKELQNEIENTALNDRRVLKEINIKSYASPDGPWAFNNELAQDREDVTKGYVNDQLKKDKIQEFNDLTAQFTPEDWEGLQKLVSQSNIQDKELILSTLSMYKDPEQREEELRNLINVFDVLADQILPQLRYSRITASIDVVGKSDSEINEAFDKNAKSLSNDELLYAATLTEDPARQEAIYRQATLLFPNDYRGWNDLGMMLYKNGDYAAAKDAFAKAAKLAAGASEPQMNLGLAELVNGNFANANKYFGSAAGQKGLADALGVYYLKQGDNAAAVRAFGDSKTNNAAIAQILTKDYSKAKATLDGVAKANALTYYLKAIVGARTNNQSMVASNLAEACKLDPKYAAMAAKDLEFAGFNVK